MNRPEDTPTIANGGVPNFQLTPPEVITPVPAEATRSAVPLRPETARAVDEQVTRFIDALIHEDVHGAEFKALLDSAFAIGREEISNAAGLMQRHFLPRRFFGAEETVYKAIAEIRGHLDRLNPVDQGDLLAPGRLFGIIPFGNKLKAYFRKFESAGAPLQKAMSQLDAARDGVHRDVVDTEAARSKLWDAMQKLAAAAQFAASLDGHLAERVQSLKATDPTRAQALEHEVLVHARQRLADILTQQAVCVNGYLALDVLKKTGREMMNGCSRVAITGMSAWAVAQTVARATGHQVQGMEALQGANTATGGPTRETGRQVNGHVEKAAEFARNPMLGIDKIKEAFDLTYKAMDAMDSFRAKAIAAMGQNNAIMAEQITRSQQHLDQARERPAREAGNAQIQGPVSL